MKVNGASFSIDMNGLKAKQAKDKAETAQSFSNQIQNKLNDTLYHPLERVYYGYQPSTADAGDVSWLFNNNNIVDGHAYRFDGYNWKPVPDSNKQIFGSQIFGADIHGASITGGTFSSESRGATGKSNFFVNTQGQIYARNYYMDIESPANQTMNSLNHRTYRGYYSPDDTDRMGFNIDNGILQMHALANQTSGNVISGTPSDFFATTYLEPDYLKLRNTNDKWGSQLLARTDIRSGSISVGKTWSEYDGTRITDQHVVVSNNGYTASLTNQGLLTNKLNVGLTYTGAYAAIGTIDNSPLQFTNPRTGQATDINFGYGYSHNGITTPALTSNGPISASTVNAGYVSASNIGKNSDLSLKKNIRDVDKNEILSKINATDIKAFQYKTQNNNNKTSIGPIIDNENIKKNYYVPHELVNYNSNNKGNDAIALDNAIAFSFAGLQQLSQEKNNLELRVAKLERKLNQK